MPTDKRPNRGRRRDEPQHEPVPVEGRVPPHDLDAEGAVVAAVLLDAMAVETTIDVLGDCANEFGERTKHWKFYSDANALVMGAVCAVRASGSPVDITTVAAWLRSHGHIEHVGGSAYLVQLVDQTPFIANVGAHAQIVMDKWRLRQLIGACQTTAAYGYGEANTQELLDTHAASVHALATAQGGEPMTHVGNGMMTMLERDHQRSQTSEGMMGRRSGIEAFDSKLTGLHDGDLYIVAARPGMGKTAFAMQLGVNIATPTQTTEQLFEDPVEYGVPIFSLEMPKEQLQVRLVCTESCTNLNKYRSGRLDPNEWQRVFGAGAHLSSLPLWIDDTAQITVGQIRAKVRKQQASWCRQARRHVDGTIEPSRRTGAIIVDYLQLLSGKGDKREEVVSAISRELKCLAKDLKVPVIALSQLNRSVETRGKDKRPQLSDLRESGAIEQDADAIIFLYREEYYNPGNTSAHNIAEIIIAKQRNGPTGKVLARFDGYCTRFSNLGMAEAQAYISEAEDE